MPSTVRCTLHCQWSKKSYSNTGSYRGQDMTRHTSITHRSSTTGEKQKQTKLKQTLPKPTPGNIQKSNKVSRGERAGRVCATVQGKSGSSRRCSGDWESTCWRFPNTYSTPTHTHTQPRHRYWPVHSHSNCPSAVGGLTFSSGNVKAEFTGGARLRLDSSIPMTTHTVRLNMCTDLCATNRDGGTCC